MGRFMATLMSFPKLLVAAVNGPAVGIGVTMLPHCDITYAYGGATGTGNGAGTMETQTHMPGSRADAVLGTAGSGKRQPNESVQALTEGPEPSSHQQGVSFWTPFFRLAIVPEFCSSVTFPEILVSVHHCVAYFVTTHISDDKRHSCLEEVRSTQALCVCSVSPALARLSRLRLAKCTCDIFSCIW